MTGEQRAAFEAWKVAKDKWDRAPMGDESIRAGEDLYFAGERLAMMVSELIEAKRSSHG